MHVTSDKVTQRRINTITRRFDEYGCSERFNLIGIIDGSHVYVECKNCGNAFSRETSFLVSSHVHNIECRACGIRADGTFGIPKSENKRGMDESEVVAYYEKGFSASQTARKFGMNLRRVRRIIDEAGVARDRQAALPIDDYVSGMTGDPWLDEEFVCSECGRVFTRNQYMTEMGRTSRMFKAPRYCSKKCRQKVQNRNARANNKQRRKAEKNCIIPLGDLIERDNGICQICGEPVDLDDGYYDGDGNFHTGKNYPTLDHILPLSRGGYHIWENVQLAHQACNSGKCDRIA